MENRYAVCVLILASWGICEYMSVENNIHLILHYAQHQIIVEDKNECVPPLATVDTLCISSLLILYLSKVIIPYTKPMHTRNKSSITYNLPIEVSA